MFLFLARHGAAPARATRYRRACARPQGATVRAPVVCGWAPRKAPPGGGGGGGVARAPSGAPGRRRRRRAAWGLFREECAHGAWCGGAGGPPVGDRRPPHVHQPAPHFFSRPSGPPLLMSDLWMCGMTPPPAIVALIRVSSSSSPRMASCKWRGVMRLTWGGGGGRAEGGVVRPTLARARAAPLFLSSSHLQVLGRVAGQLQHLGGEVLWWKGERTGGRRGAPDHGAPRSKKCAPVTTPTPSSTPRTPSHGRRLIATRASRAALGARGGRGRGGRPFWGRAEARPMARGPSLLARGASSSSSPPLSYRGWRRCRRRRWRRRGRWP